MYPDFSEILYWALTFTSTYLLGVVFGPIWIKPGNVKEITWQRWLPVKMTIHFDVPEVEPFDWKLFLMIWLFFLLLRLIISLFLVGGFVSLISFLIIKF